VRVPELGPCLGRLIVPWQVSAPWVVLDDLREQLATDVLELAGMGRAAAERDDRAGVLSVTGRRAWETAWEQAVRQVAERVADALDGDIERAAWRVRMPLRRRRRHLLTGSERRAIGVRLAAGATPFLAAAAAVDAAAADVRSGRDAGAVARWQEALRTVARRLEAAWLALEEEVEAERERWAPELATIAGWRPPLWPVVTLWAPVSALLIWLGLVLGGYVPAPAWLAARLGF
jgi:hypothetical protein